MSKESFYFSHDYNARNDEKIKRLIRKHGLLGYGIFWVIIEDLYNNANALRTDYEGIAYDLRTDSEIIRSIVNDFELFVIENGFFGSLSIERRLDDRNKKSEKARESAYHRWPKPSVIDANALPPQSEGNAIKDSIGKNSKEKNNKSSPTKSVDFIDRIINAFVEEHGSYEVVTIGIERSMAGKLAKKYKEIHPEANTEETIDGLREYFKKCVNVNDSWLKDNMSLTTIVTKFNVINKILNNGKSRTKKEGASPNEIANAVAKNFADDYSLHNEEHAENKEVISITRS